MGVAYGSTLVSPVEPLPSAYGMQPSQREIGALVLAFDVFIHNTDRRADNPNLFVTRSDLVVFDHEIAFDFLVPIIGGPDLVTDHRPDLIRRHPLFGSLRGRAPTPDTARARVLALDDLFFRALAGATPAGWTDEMASGKLDKIVEVLQKRRDAVDVWLPKVFACLDP